MNIFKHIFLIAMIATTSFSVCQANDRIYFEIEEVNSDEFGCYIESKECRIGKHAWQCPYCSSWWPLGRTCKNSFCPSNYGNSYNEFGWDLDDIEFEWD